MNELVALAEDEAAEPDSVFAALSRLLALDPAAGISTALGLLSRPPRYKPSTGLLVDPADRADRRWRVRVAAGAALVASAASLSCVEEVIDELADCPDLAAEVLDRVAPHPGLPAGRLAAAARPPA